MSAEVYGLPTPLLQIELDDIPDRHPNKVHPASLKILNASHGNFVPRNERQWAAYGLYLMPGTQSQV